MDIVMRRRSRQGNGGTHNLIENPILTIKPKQTLLLPSGQNYNFTIGARVLQSPSGASGTITEFDAVSDPERPASVLLLLISTVNSHQISLMLPVMACLSKVSHHLSLLARLSCRQFTTAHLKLEIL